MSLRNVLNAVKKCATNCRGL